MKKSTKKTVTKKATTVKPKSEKQVAVQEALQTTWLLKGNLKNVQLSYLRVGKLLSQVREKQMFTALGHPDIEDYAAKRLQLGRSSLYKYLQVYDWTVKNHPEWLEKKPKGFIPDLYDVSGLITIEQELAKKDISSSARTSLQNMKAKALTGELTSTEVKKLQKSGNRGAESLKSFLSKLRNLRMRGSQLGEMPDEVIAHLDEAIGILKNGHSLAMIKMINPDRAVV